MRHVDISIDLPAYPTRLRILIVRPERRRIAPKSKDCVAAIPFASTPAALRSGRAEGHCIPGALV
jgi:hypothetical protein